MGMGRHEFASLAVILFSIIVSIYSYPLMPQKMATHWNAEGIADGFMDKLPALLIVPAISIIVAIVLFAMPRIDPLGKNIGKFSNVYGNFIVVVLAFLAYVHLLMVFAGLGYGFSMVSAIAPGIAVFFYYLGKTLEVSKRNWTVGIRTPWTLSSGRVWDRTHKRGGKLFKIASVFALAGALFPKYALFVIILPIIAIAIYLFAYSYFEYGKEKEG